MRWMWIDRFVAFESGKRASAIKNVSLSEDHVHDPHPGYPVLPPVLMIEGMAQTAGILVGEAGGFAENVILAKIRLAEFTEYAYPGDRVRYDAEVESIDERGAATAGVVWINDRRAGRVDLMFSHVRPGSGAGGLPDQNFVFSGNFAQLLAGLADASRPPPPGP